jgi:hypothetical protein
MGCVTVPFLRCLHVGKQPLKISFPAATEVIRVTWANSPQKATLHGTCSQLLLLSLTQASNEQSCTQRSMAVNCCWGPRQHSCYWFRAPSGLVTNLMFVPRPFLCLEMGPSSWTRGFIKSFRKSHSKPLANHGLAVASFKYTRFSV